MADDVPAKLQATDHALLTNIVRQDQRSHAFEVLDWSVSRLSDQGVINPDGLWLISGHGRDAAGSRPWSVALKLFVRPPDEVAPDNTWYWKRELLVAQSILTATLPSPVRAPRIYRAEETETGAAIWMEHVRDRHSGRWALDTFALAARQFGRCNGTAASQTPPDEPWLTRRLYHTWNSWADPAEDLRSPLCHGHIAPADRARYERLLVQRNTLHTAIERLPNVFSHFDSQRRNLLYPPEGASDELVILDWAQCGLGPLGAEMAHMVGFSAVVLEWPPARLLELEAAVLAAYILGLRDVGWHGSEEEVRLAYLAWSAAGLGYGMPGMIRYWCAVEQRPTASKLMGLSEMSLLWPYLDLFKYCLDCGDEALAMIGAAPAGYQ